MNNNLYDKMIHVPKQMTQATFHAVTGAVKTTVQVPQKTVEWVKQKTCGTCGKNSYKS